MYFDNFALTIIIVINVFSTGFADASVAPIDFPIAPAAAMPKVQ